MRKSTLATRFYGKSRRKIQRGLGWTRDTREARVREYNSCIRFQTSNHCIFFRVIPGTAVLVGHDQPEFGRIEVLSSMKFGHIEIKPQLRRGSNLKSSARMPWGATQLPHTNLALLLRVCHVEVSRLMPPGGPPLPRPSAGTATATVLCTA